MKCLSRLRLAFFGVVLIAMLLFCSFHSEAKTGLDVNGNGFGPTIKGMQIGESYEFFELISKIEKLVGRGTGYMILIEEQNASRNAARICVANEHDRGWKIGGWGEFGVPELHASGIFNKWKIKEKIPNLEEFLKEVHSIIEYETSDEFSDFHLTLSIRKLCEIKAIWGQFVSMAEDGTRTGDVYNIYRIFSMEFSRPVFGASNMPVREFAQELIDSYSLPNMEGFANGWKTSESENYKNGWGVNVFANDSWLAPSIRVFNTNVRGKTSFD